MAPYAFFDKQGHPVGVATELSALVAERLGVRLEYVQGLSWGQLLEGTRRREVDLLTTATYRPDRDAFLNFTENYLMTPLVVMTRTEPPRLRSLEQLNGRRVALVKHYSSSEQAIERYPQMQVLAVSSPLEGLLAVSDGRVEAYIGSLGVNTFTASRNGISNLKVNTSFSENGQSYGVRKDWPELVPLLQKALDSIPENEKQAILSRWVSVSIESLTSTDTALNETVRAKIKALPQLRVGVLQDRPPFDFVNANGRQQGLAADVLATLVKHTGLNTRTISGSSSKQLLAQLSAGELDLVLAVNGAAPGVPKSILSQPYLVSSLGVFVRKDDVFLGELSDLFDHRVAVHKGSYAQEILNMHPRIALVPQKSQEAAAQALLNAEVDYLVAETTSALRVVEDASLLGLRYAGPLSQAPVRLSIAVSPQLAGLRELIDIGLDQITSEEAADIRRQWVGAPLQGGVTLQQVLRWTLVLALLVALGALAFYLLNRKLKHEVVRQTRLYAALTRCNEAMARCTSQEELFSQVCRIAVKYGGMQTSWIGLVDTTTSLITPVASFGDRVDAYLQEVEISVDASSPFGQGLTGPAIREHRAVWCQDVQHDERLTPWHAIRVRLGIRWGSMGVLPLYRQGVPIGVIALNARPTNAFDESARRLLVDMAADISFALDNFAGRAERDQAQAQARKSDAAFRTLFESSRDAITLTSQKGHFIGGNKAAFDLFGCRNKQEFISLSVADASPEFQPDGRRSSEKVQELVDTAIRQGACAFEWVHRRVDGSEFFADIVLSGVEYDDAPAVQASVRDITDRKQADAQLRNLSLAVEQSPVSIIITNLRAEIEYVNETFVQKSGFSREEVIGQNPKILQSGATPQQTFAELWDTLNQGLAWKGELYNKSKDGSELIEQCIITPIRQADGSISHYVAVNEDITAQKAAAEQIEKLAFYDPLTNLPNRRLLLDRLQHSLAADTRDPRRSALLFIDLDHFKSVNDTLGHTEGDRLLKQVSERLSSCIRGCDTAARLGGDEFVVLLEDLAEGELEAATQTRLAGEKILKELRRTYSLASGPHHVTASIGLALFGGPLASEASDPLIRADQAMHQAKSAGRDTLFFFDSKIQANADAQTALEASLRRALETEQFILHYQPQVSLLTGKLTGLEALIRWQRPDGQLVPPNDFIPAAERIRLINPLGKWVIEEACAQIRAWREAGLSPVKVAVNVLAHQFLAGDLDMIVAQALKKNDVEPHLLDVEITESVLMHDPVAAGVLLGRIKATGISLSLDDFGTGYSSLAYLSRFPFNLLKIDRSFVQNMVTDPDAATIVKMIIDLAHHMRMNVIAEGVETEAQLSFLRSNNCDQIQGYLFSRPVPSHEMSALLQEGRTLPIEPLP